MVVITTEVVAEEAVVEAVVEVEVAVVVMVAMEVDVEVVVAVATVKERRSDSQISSTQETRTRLSRCVAFHTQSVYVKSEISSVTLEFRRGILFWISATGSQPAMPLYSLRVKKRLLVLSQSSTSNILATGMWT